MGCLLLPLLGATLLNYFSRLRLSYTLAGFTFLRTSFMLQSLMRFFFYLDLLCLCLTDQVKLEADLAGLDLLLDLDLRESLSLGCSCGGGGKESVLMESEVDSWSGRLRVLRERGLAVLLKLIQIQSQQRVAQSFYIMKTCILIINKLHEPEAVLLKRTALEILSRSLLTPHTFLFDSQNSLRDCEGLAGEKSVYSAEWQMKVNYGISIGGDGTLLYMMKKFQNRRSPPVYVFQKGTLGFLCIYESKQMQKTMEGLAQNINQGVTPKTFQISRLFCRAFNKTQSICSYHALNQITLHKGSRFRPIDFSISLNGHPFTNSRGDGLIVGTQTGSTAYSLSANGPIVCQGSKATLLVPLAPQSLSFRPVALPNTIRIGLKLLGSEGSKTEGEISCDGQMSFKIDENCQVEIESSKFPVQLVLPSDAEGDILFMKKVVSVLRWNCPFGSTL